MNTQRLRELIDKLLEVDERLAISAALKGAAVAMQNVVNEPSQAQHQAQYSTLFQTLQQKTMTMLAEFTPAEFELMDEIKARPMFGQDFTEELVEAMRSNGVTPAVVLNKLVALRDHRQKYLDGLTILRDRLQAIGIVASNVRPGNVELGILLPRELFSNRFDELVKHLDVLNKVLRIFSEVANGTAEPIEVDQISTSDPTFYLGMSADVAVMVAGCVTWAILTWKSIEDIRKVRVEIRKLNAEGKDALEESIEKMITETLDKSISTKVKELLPPDSPPGRKLELNGSLEWALDQVLSRVERGVTVELRFLPPKSPKGQPPITEEQLRPFQALQELSQQLKFPEPTANPIRPLPSPEPPQARG